MGNRQQIQVEEGSGVRRTGKGEKRNKRGKVGQGMSGQ